MEHSYKPSKKSYVVMCVGVRDIIRDLENRVREIRDQELVETLTKLIRDLEREVMALESEITELNTIIEVCCDQCIDEDL